LQSCELDGRAVDQGDDGGVAAPAENVVQSGAERTELALFGLGILGQECALSVDHGFELRRVRSGYDDDKIGVGVEGVNGSGEKRAALRVRGRPGEEGFIASHAR